MYVYISVSAKIAVPGLTSYFKVCHIVGHKIFYGGWAALDILC